MNNQPLNLEAAGGEAIAGGGDASVSIVKAIRIVRTWSPEDQQAFKAQVEAAPDAAAAEKALQDQPDLWQIFQTVPARHLLAVLGVLISLLSFIESSIQLALALDEDKKSAPTVQPNVTINVNVNNRTVIDFSTPPPHEPR